MVLVVGERLRRVEPAHGLALEFDVAGIADDAVEDGVREGRLPDGLVPEIGGEPADDHGRLAHAAAFDDLEQAAPRVGGEFLQSPVVEDDEVRPREAVRQPVEAVAVARPGQLDDEFRHAAAGPWRATAQASHALPQPQAPVTVMLTP